MQRRPLVPTPSTFTPAGSTNLTYCTNVHPAETWAEVQNALSTHTLKIRDRWWQARGVEAPFPVGLRLSAQAARELTDPQKLAELRSFLAQEHLEVFTLNGFPYGTFHGAPVKSQVYAPDWTSPARVDYTLALVALLAELLPPGRDGSVSTVPLAFKRSLAERGQSRSSGPTATLLARHLAHVCGSLTELRERTGKRVVLALEPEPGCELERLDEVLEFFERDVFGGALRQAVQEALGCSTQRAETALREHLGVCLDTCHSSVEFEAPLMAYQRLREAGICVAKVQISAGLCVVPSATALAELEAFDEPVYLHQVVAKRGQELRRFEDLPLALGGVEPGNAAADEQWRVHFHVPLFSDQFGPFSSTRSELVPLLKVLGEELAGSATFAFPHLEVETYTWGVLPAAHRDRSLDEAVYCELEWSYRALWGDSCAPGTPQAQR